MSIFKSTEKMYGIELRVWGTVRKFSGFTDKGLTKNREANIKKLRNYVEANVDYAALNPELNRWLESIPDKLYNRFVKVGLIDRQRAEQRAAAAKPLTEQLNEFRQMMAGNKERTVRQACNSLLSTFEACGFVYFRDIESVKLDCFLRGKYLPRDQRTYNYNLKAVKQFCRWLVKNGRASVSPVAHLSPVQVTNPKRKRRAIKPSELSHLLEATEAAPDYQGISGSARALLYRLAASTGLRANELRTLQRKDIDFEHRFVTVESSNAKNKKLTVLPLRQGMSAELKAFCVGKMPTARVFKVPNKPSLMIKADLELAGIPYKDEAGQVFDFHSLRHQFGTMLAASGTHPKLAQKLMRHSDINLTMNYYTHTYLEDEAEAVEKLPDLTEKKEAKKLA